MLEVSDILQIDATVIAGILILLTISSYKVSGSDSKKYFRGFTKEGMTALVVIPFGISAILSMGRCMFGPSSVWTPIPDCSLIPFDLVFPIGGFLYVILVICMIARYSRVQVKK